MTLATLVFLAAEESGHGNVALETVVLTRVPSVVHAVMAAMATRASSRAYSTVVRPS
jgi:hypothetical protein